MAYQTLYRKYRPKTFELVYGQDNIIKTLKNVIKNDKLSHAYLFTGPRGTGKTSSAKLFAKAINCLNNRDGDACNECDNCKSFNENSNPDIIEIDAASNNGVDEIREIRNKVNLVPSMSKYKVYIIDEVHMLSIGAFNALLKTLEEPPEYIIFILATTEPHKLPMTVISRCQRFDFRSISNRHMKECLSNIITIENIKIDDDALEEIINNSRGGLRDAIGMLDQAFAFSNENITINDINELSGNITNNELYELFNDIINENYQDIIQKSEIFSDGGKDFYLIVEKLINFVRKGIIYKKTGNNLLNSIEKEFIEQIDSKKIYDIMDILSDMLIKIQKSPNKKITFQIKMLQLIDQVCNDLKKENNNYNFKIDKRKTLEEESKIKENNVPRETLTDLTNSCDLELFKLLNDLKNVRINNILKESTKKELLFVSEMWDNINEYLLDSKYKLPAGILIDSKPVAASNNGVIVVLPLDSSVNRIEKKYDESKELINKILDNNYKIVYISESFWKKIRPEYAIKVRKNELELISEDSYLSKIKKIKENESVNEFDDLIEMEEK